MSTRFVSYSVYITHNQDGYTAVCPAFPHLTGSGRGARSAYSNLKKHLDAHVRFKLASFEALPKDPVVQARKLRLDLWYLNKQESLG